MRMNQIEIGEHYVSRINGLTYYDSNWGTVKERTDLIMNGQKGVLVKVLDIGRYTQVVNACGDMKITKLKGKKFNKAVDRMILVEAFAPAHTAPRRGKAVQLPDEWHKRLVAPSEIICLFDEFLPKWKIHDAEQKLRQAEHKAFADMRDHLTSVLNKRTEAKGVPASEHQTSRRYLGRDMKSIDVIGMPVDHYLKLLEMSGMKVAAKAFVELRDLKEPAGPSC